jgi:hypothetical protein
MAEAVYVMSALTSVACAALLWRGWRRTATSLLWWSAWCFVGLAVNSILVVIDLVVIVDRDLSLLRALTAFTGLAVLAFALVLEDR